MASATPKGPEPVAGGLTDAAWMDVLQAVDRTYAELVDYQEQLERQNAETAMLRRFMESVLGSVSDALIVVDRQGRVEEASRSTRASTAASATPSPPPPPPPCGLHVFMHGCGMGAVAGPTPYAFNDTYTYVA